LYFFIGKQTGWLRCSLPNAPAALCLNGQPYNYFIRPTPLPNPTNSWNIYLEGSGSSPDRVIDNFCFDPKSCLAKAKLLVPFDSPEFTKTLVYLDSQGGILAFDPNSNKEFSKFNIVLLPSCDGSGFLGDLKDPIKLNQGPNSTLYLRGFVNLMAAYPPLISSLK
jgi:Pectinacetylesterase